VCFSESKKTKGEDEERRRREKTILPELGFLFVSIVGFSIVVRRYVLFFVRFSTTSIGLWYFFSKMSLWVFWLRN